MSRLNTICAVILLVTYIKFCNAEITLADIDDAQTTDSYNTQSSEEWFDPMKQKQNQTVEDVLRSLIPNAPFKAQRIIPEDNEERDEIEEDSVESSTITQDLYKSSNLENDYATVTSTDIANESTTFNILTKETDELGDLSKPIAAELSSNKQSKMIVSSHETVPPPVSQIYSENTVHTDAGDQFGSANMTDDSTSMDESDVENRTTVSISKPSPPTISTLPHRPKHVRPVQTIQPQTYKLDANKILRLFLNDTYIRKPMAALIDTSPDVLRKTKVLWKSALRPNSALDIVLVAFNTSGKTFL